MDADQSAISPPPPPPLRPPSSSSAPSSKPPCRFTSSLPSTLSSTLSTTNATLTHLTRLLSSPSQTDTLLLTLTYTLRLLSLFATHLTRLRLYLATLSLARHISRTAPTTLLPGETLIATISPRPSSSLVRLQASTQALLGLIDEYRTFSRLWGLLGIWSWALKSWETSPRDRVLWWIRWLQILMGAGFQGLENVAYLGSKGVLSGKVWEGERTGKWYIWSARFWMGHVGLEFVRLGREWTLKDQKLRTSEAKDEEGKKEVPAEEERKEVEKWWRDLKVNFAWAPITVHYSLEGGLLSSGSVAALGLIPALTALREVWTAT